MTLGYSETIRTKFFYDPMDNIDKQINEWLEENPNVEIIEIKFAASATRDDWSTDALIIYRKKRTSPSYWRTTESKPLI